MNASEINNIIGSILTHHSPVVFGNVSDDVKRYLEQLYSAGDIVVPHIVSAVTACANGHSGGEYWWKGAGELCKLLSRLGSPTAKTALLTILKTDSRIVEFDDVRATAAIQLSNFKDPQLVHELTECSKMPNAPVSAINQSIAVLGGQALASPEAVIAEGRGLDPKQAVEYFSRYENEVTKWSKEKQGGFYYFAGRKAEQAYGSAAALPLYAASLLAYSGSDAAAWQSFPNYKPSQENAKLLGGKYPLRKNHLAAFVNPSQE